MAIRAEGGWHEITILDQLQVDTAERPGLGLSMDWLRISGSFANPKLSTPRPWKALFGRHTQAVADTDTASGSFHTFSHMQLEAPSEFTPVQRIDLLIYNPISTYLGESHTELIDS